MFVKKKSSNSTPSLRGENGAFMLCPTCGERLIGYGDTGGYCVRCDKWCIDNKLVHSRLKKYGKACETLCVLVAYDDVRMHYGMFDDVYGTLYITPFSLLFRPESKEAAIKRGNGKLRRSPDISEAALISPFSEISNCQAYGGFAPAMNIYFNPDPGGRAVSCSYSFAEISSYDGAEGNDFKRIRQLILGLKACLN